MGVDWRAENIQPGDWVCFDHGVIQPVVQVVPCCPCGRLTLKAVIEDGKLAYGPGRPSHCTKGHPLLPGKVLLGYRGCLCNAGGGHHTWLCRTDVGGVECGDIQEAPPHDIAASAPYFGPGSTDR